MKIKKLILENFAGIYEGIGKDKIEIDFSNTTTNNKIIMLAGRNASGKSTTLSCLHPLAENGDDRKDIILEGTNGYKEIHIEMNGNLYVIKHFYKKSTKSFISKNGTELNENGGVTTFKNIVKEELDFDDSYFKIGRVGDNVTNFIDMPKTMRKNYIFENFLPGVDTYMQYFSIIKGKFSKVKSDIKFVSEQLNKVGDIVNLTNLKEVYDKSLDEKESELSAIEKKINTIEGNISSSLDFNKIDETLVNPYFADLSKLQNLIKSSMQIVKEFEDKYKTLKEKYKEDIELIDSDINTISESIIKDEKESSILNNNLDNINKYISDISNMEQKEVNMLNNFQSNDINKLYELKSEKEEIIETISKEINDSKFDNIRKVNPESANFSNDIFNLKELLTAVKLDIAPSILDELLKIKYDNNFNDSYFKDLVIKNNTLKEELNSEIDESRSELYRLNSEAEAAEVLKKRPDNCVIDTCAFIQNALKYKDSESKIEPMNIRIDKLIEKRTAIEKEIENTELLNDAYKSIKSLYNNFKHLENNELFQLFKLYDFFISLTTFLNLIQMPLHDIDKLFNVDSAFKFFNDVKYHDKEVSLLKDINDKIQIYTNQQSILDSVKAKIHDYRNTISEKKAEKEKLLESIKINDSKLSRSKLKKSILIKYKSNLLTISNNKNEYKSHKENYDRLELVISKIKSLNKDKESLNEKSNLVKVQIKDIKNNLKTIEVSISKYEEYDTLKKKLDVEFEAIELIYDSLHPSKGIPVHLIGNYLKDTANIANKFLDISQKGNFRIKFDVDEKEFNIPVIKNNIINRKDIKVASQGETSLSKVAISFALIQQSIKKYVILSLDEMDATLDAENSRHYVNILDKQLEHLGCEQAFVISHSREFDAHDVDLVLFDGHNLPLNDPLFMNGKSVIFDTSTI